jgi:hypothetical protein
MEQQRVAQETSPASQADLAECYRQMATDIQDEMGAEEWAESLDGENVDASVNTVH